MFSKSRGEWQIRNTNTYPIITNAKALSWLACSSLYLDHDLKDMFGLDNKFPTDLLGYNGANFIFSVSLVCFISFFVSILFSASMLLPLELPGSFISLSKGTCAVVLSNSLSIFTISSVLRSGPSDCEVDDKCRESKSSIVSLNWIFSSSFSAP